MIGRRIAGFALARAAALLVLASAAIGLSAYAATVDDNYTVLLIHADGADATTVFSDVARQRTVTANGNAQVDTAQSKFGGASVFFDGSGDYLSLSDNADYEFGSGDFTIDLWARFNAADPGDVIAKYSGSYSPFTIYRNGTTLQFYASSGGPSPSWDICNATSIGTIANGTWYHVAIARSGSSIRTFLNGTAGTTCTSSAAMVDNAGALTIGGGLGGPSYDVGWIDEVRLSKGVARWTANFTPPTVPYKGGITLTGNVKFAGNLAITGALSKGAGTFVIDHPLFPRTKLLYHSFVESPDVKNLYDGVATLDERGEATILLPGYFEALNKNFRYQFFPHYQPMPDLYVKEEVHDNQFTIAGGRPGGEITWQVTGIRHDPYILANPVVNEVWKSDATEVNRGECLFEPLCL